MVSITFILFNDDVDPETKEGSFVRFARVSAMLEKTIKFQFELLILIWNSTIRKSVSPESNSNSSHNSQASNTGPIIPANVDKCGYLTKEGGRFKSWVVTSHNTNVNSWKKRWCVLKNDSIYYAKERVISISAYVIFRT